MKREEALQSLGLHSDPSPVEVSAACETKRRQLEERLTRAPTPALRKKYETALSSLEQARSIVLGVTGEADAALSSSDMDDLPAATPVAGPGDGSSGNSRASLELGTTLKGRYELRTLLGAGGMGAVYGAFDRDEERDVAIKVMLPELLQDRRARERFVAEGRITHALSHPGIVQVLDVGVDGDFHFMAMELLQGRTLRHEIETRVRAGKTFPVREVQKIAQSLCDALSYAHEHTVHRDVKPENIWIGVDGNIKLMDFGVAKFLESVPGTQSTALGTAYYMAPEQMKSSRDVDARADQYSLGVVLYELLTGQVPAGIIEPIRTFRKDVPPGMEEAIERALSAKPDRRFRDMDSLASMLSDRSSRSSKSVSGKQTPRSPSPVGLVLVAIMALAAVGGVGFWMWQEEEVRAAIDTAVADAASATRREGAELTSAIENLQALETEFEGRPEEELEAARELLIGLRERQDALSQAPSAAIYETIKFTLKRLDQRAKRLEKEAQQSRQRVNSLGSKLLSSRLEPEQKLRVEQDLEVARERLAVASQLERLASDHVFRGAARKSLEFHWSQGKDFLDTAQLDKARDSFAKATVEVNRLSSWPDAAEEYITRQRALSKKLAATFLLLREDEQLLYGYVEAALEKAETTIEAGDAHAARTRVIQLESVITKADAAVEARRECLRVRQRVERMATVPALSPSLEHGDRLVAAAGKEAAAGKLDESLESFAAARAHFEELHVRAEEETRKLIGRAREQRAAGEYSQALASLESALAIDPDDAKLRQLHQEVSTDVQVVTTLRSGRAKLLDRDLRGAAEEFSRALVLSPALEQARDRDVVAGAFFAVAEAYKTGTGVGRDYSQAATWYTRAGMVYSAAGQRQRNAACLFFKGLCLQRDVNPDGNWAQSARAFERASLEYKALDLPGEYIRSRDAQAHSTELSGDWNTAAGLHKELALLHANAGKPGAQAESLSRRAYCLEPSRNPRGSWQEASDIYKDAIRIYRKLGPEYRKEKRLTMIRQHECVEAMRGGN